MDLRDTKSFAGMKTIAERQLEDVIIPFWKKLRDNEYGGYYGYVDYDLKLDPTYEKGCILNSRILWFFSNAAAYRKDNSLRAEADHAYAFLRNAFLDKEEGGLYWSVSYDGKPLDTTKHVYNQAFAIYGLSSYYKLTGNEEALQLAVTLYELIERRMRDKDGYLEAFNRDFTPASNEKLSENGVSASRTMNTILHVMEGYTELYAVTKDERVRQSLMEILQIVETKIYNPKLHRQEVFFDLDYNSLIDLYSYGHDIEAAWLIDRTLETLGDAELTEKLLPMTSAMAREVYRVAFDGRSIPAEAERGVVKEDRVWWVQAEGVNGFLNEYAYDPSHPEYLEAAVKILEFIDTDLTDKRPGSEWYWVLHKDGSPVVGEPIAEPWKCPYHNGRMCLEILRRA